MAACQPDPIGASPTVNCTAAGGTQTTTVGTGAEDNRTVTVQSGATIDVSGTPGANAIDLRDGNAVTNGGTIIVGDTANGISVRDNNIITNTGMIRGGDSAFGIFAGNGNFVSNSGSILVDNSGAGINVCCDNTVINSGSISAGDNGVGIFASDRATITNSGTITVLNTSGPFAAYGILADGDGAPLLLGPNATITNSGTINTGDGSVGIGVLTNYNVINSGVLNVGPNGSGIQLGSNNQVTNSGTIRVGAGGIAFDLNGLPLPFGPTGTNTIINSGSVFAPNGFAIAGFGVANNTITNTGYMQGTIVLLGSNNTLTNQGFLIIGDPAAYSPGIALLVGGANQLINNPSGTIAVRVDPFSNDAFQADTVTLNGGRLLIVVTPGLYGNITTYSTAATGAAPIASCGCTPIAGQFSTVVATSPFFTAAADYSTVGEVDVILNRIGFGSVPGMTPNQRAVGNALEGVYSTTLTGDAATFFGNLLATTSVTVLDLLSGEGTSAVQNAAFSAGSLFNKTIQTHSLFAPDLGGLNVVVPPPQYAPTATRVAPGHEAFASLDKTAATAQQPGGFRVWTAGFGATQSLQGQPDVGSYSQSVRSAGGVLGLDWQAAPDLRVGFAAGVSESTFSVASLLTSGRLMGGHVGAYALKTWGAYYAAGSLSYARFDNSTTRTIIGVGPTEQAFGRFDSDQLGGRLELGWRQVYGRFNVTPFVAVEPSVLWQRSYTETGNGILGLNVASQTATSLPTFVGVQFDGRYITPEGAVLAPYSRVSWVHEFEPDRRVSAAFVTLPGASFTVNGARAAEDSARLDAGAKLMFRGGLALFANFAGEWSDRTQSYAGTGGFRYAW